MPYNNHACTILIWILSFNQYLLIVMPIISIIQDIHGIHLHQNLNMEDQRVCVVHSIL